MKHLQSIILLPGVVTLLVPSLILTSGRTLETTWLNNFPLSWIPLLLGLGLIGVGLGLVGQTVILFERVGQGTLAPWAPPTKLVARGIYRRVRNPMITGVACILLGEAVMLGVPGLFYWWAGVCLVNLVYIPLLEEPGLERRFGEEYRRYKRAVPRWIPRKETWEGTEE